MAKVTAVLMVWMRAKAKMERKPTQEDRGSGRLERLQQCTRILLVCQTVHTTRHIDGATHIWGIVDLGWGRVAFTKRILIVGPTPHAHHQTLRRDQLVR